MGPIDTVLHLHYYYYYYSCRVRRMTAAPNNPHQCSSYKSRQKNDHDYTESNPTTPQIAMMQRSTLSTINILLLCFVAVHSFRAVIVVAPPSSSRNRIGSSLLHSTTVDAADILVATTTETSNNNNLLTRDRYIATNRFTVRRGREAKFEKRWALRKSRLATLDGFKYFHLMRRVVVDDVANTGKLYLTTNVSIWFHSSLLCGRLIFIISRHRSAGRHRPLWQLYLIYYLVREETFQCMAWRRGIQGGTWRYITICIRIDNGRVGYGP